MNTFKSKILKIDSSQATSYLNEEKTAFRTQFNTNISIEHDEAIIYSLISCVVPYSWYSTNKNNNVLDYSINNVQHTILMAYGNYSATEYLKEFLIILNVNNLEMNYHRIQNKFSFKTTTPNSIIKFLFKTGVNTSKSCHKFLGFGHEDIEINNNGITSSQSILMNEIYYLNLKTDLGSSVIESNDVNNILEVIPINVSPLAYIDYHPINTQRYILNSRSLNDITINLVDNNHLPLDLNNLPFYITIKIEVIINENHQKDDPRSKIINDQTNLEMFTQNPDLLKSTSETNPISMNDYLDYLNLESMIRKINLKEKKLKAKNKKLK